MRKLSLTTQAELDFLEIWNRLAEEDFPAAQRFNIQVDVDIQRLLQFPGIGHHRPDLTKRQVRLWQVASWFIGYRYTDEFLIILRVVHSSRNLKKILDSPR